MMSEMKCKGLVLWAVAAALVATFAAEPLLAQEAASPDAAIRPADGADAEVANGEAKDAGAVDAGEDGGKDGGGGSAGSTAKEPEPSSEGASEATRLVRIRRVIELDKERLEWLKGELRERTRWFEDLAQGIQEIKAERAEKQAEIEALEANPRADPKKLERLRDDLSDDQEDFSLFETQTDLALQAEKTVRAQLEALEKKIEQDRHALGHLTGEIPAELEEPAKTAPGAEAAAPPSTERALPTPYPIPVATDRPAAQAPKETKTSSKMTAAQLQAKQALAKAEREVQAAKTELSDFIERKRALQEQIEFEQELGKNDASELENLKKALGLMEARLETYREEGRSAERIRQRENKNRRIAEAIEEGERGVGARAEYIESLQQRLVHLEEAQVRITAEVDEALESAEDARQSVKWLESPIHPQNVLYWAKERGPRMLLVIVAAMLLMLFVQLSARRIARAVVRRRREDARGAGTGRADTLAFSFRSVSRVLIVIFGTLLVLQEAGVDIKTVLGGAAILGVAFAFGAQDLMRDYFSGFLILAEDQYQLGDLVTISGVTGTVESVNMRVTVLRDLEGRVHFMPNGNIDHVTNRTYAWGRPVFEIPVRFDEDVDRVMEVLAEVATELSNDPDWKGSIIGEPEMLGVDRFTDYGLVIKFMVKTQPDKLFLVRREMLRRIAKRFNELGIQITVPQRILVRDGTEGEAL
jgi:small conductance mechanosensitive channel